MIGYRSLGLEVLQQSYRGGQGKPGWHDYMDDFPVEQYITQEDKRLEEMMRRFYENNIY